MHFPRLQIVLGIKLKTHVLQLVGPKALPSIEQHVLAGWRAVGKAVAQVKPEGHSVHQPRGRGPVPAVAVGPAAAPPVQHPKARLRRKAVLIALGPHPALGGHTVYLLVVVKGCTLLGPTGGNGHPLLLRRLPQHNLALQAGTRARLYARPRRARRSVGCRAGRTTPPIRKTQPPLVTDPLQP